jgi:putative acetyltransferase
MDIRVDDLRGPEIKELLEAHLELMRAITPPESVHALDLEGLRAPEVTFWTMWIDDALLCCGALKEIGPAHGEIKSMHTAARARGRGLARKMVDHILNEARARKYTRLSLETGSFDAFIPARTLYADFGFQITDPFGDYELDPNSTYMTLELA